MMSKVIYKVNDEYTELYQDALAMANGNEYILKPIYIELEDSATVSTEYTLEELVKKHLAKENATN